MYTRSINTILRICAVVFLFGCVSLTSSFAHANSDHFFANLQSLCGAQFVGAMIYPEDGQDSFANKELVADFKSCTQNEVRVAFAVGEDQSRTWVFSHSEDGLLLKHDHRHADGSPDEITDYGGWAVPQGTSLSQSFAADPHTAKLIPEASTNVWTVELSEDQKSLRYYLERHGQPRFEAWLYQ